MKGAVDFGLWMRFEFVNVHKRFVYLCMGELFE